MSRHLIRATIAAVLLFFFAVPLAFVFMAAGGALGGVAIVGGLILLQLPVFLLLKYAGLLPSADPSQENDHHD